jgi:hypothetical protein
VCGNKTKSGLADDLLQREAIAIGRIAIEQVVLDQQNFRDVFAGQLISESRDALSNDYGADCARRGRCNLLRGYQRFETCVVPFALALLGDDEDFHGQITRASKRSFSTSFAAISLGVPVRNSVFFVLVGT